MRFILTMALGAIPATILCSYMPFVFAMGLSSFQFGSVDDAIKLILTSLAAVLGTVSLWVVASKPPTLLICLGLVAGLFAIAPLTFAFALGEGALRFRDWMESLFYGPPIVALYWLGHYVYSIATKSTKPKAI